MTQDQLDFLYKKLSSPDFANPETGNLAFPSYTVVYEPQFDHQLADTLQKLAAHLIRPQSYAETLVVNVFAFFLDYIKSLPFGRNQSLYEAYLKTEPQNPAYVLKGLAEKAQSDEFIARLYDHIRGSFLETDNANSKSYVFVYGFAQIYPYLRTKHFLNKMERYTQGYKLIVFYPGNSSLTGSKPVSLFGRLKPEPYRSTKLISLDDEL